MTVTPVAVENVDGQGGPTVFSTWVSPPRPGNGGAWGAPAGQISSGSSREVAVLPGPRCLGHILPFGVVLDPADPMLDGPTCEGGWVLASLGPFIGLGGR